MAPSDSKSPVKASSEPFATEAERSNGSGHVPQPGKKEVVVETDIFARTGTLGRELGKTGTVFRQDSELVRKDGRGLIHLKAASLPYEYSDLPDVRLVKRAKDANGAIVTIPYELSTHHATLLIASRGFLDEIPQIKATSHCPVLVERNERLEVITEFDHETGILAEGDKPPEMDAQKAVSLLLKILDDFDFQTPGDRSRAVAAIITPALVFSGLLGGRAPLDMGEADHSQSGKGYRHRLTAAIHQNQTP